MKTGVVLQLEKNKALVLQDGAYIKVKPEADWVVGQVVVVPRKQASVAFIRVLAAAACLLFVAALGIFSYNAFFLPVSYISFDVNPSIELTLNRQGRVLAVEAYNQQGEEVLEGVDLKGKHYEEAMRELVQSDLVKPYYEQEGYLLMSVYSSWREAEILAYLDQLTVQMREEHPGLQARCSNVSETTMQAAHRHGVSCGKMQALEELQRLDPDVQVEEYAYCDIGEIEEQVQACRGNQNHGGGAGYGQTEEAQSDVAANSVVYEPEPESQTSDHGHGHGHGGHSDR